MNNVGISIYDQAEVLDFAGPFEVFATAKQLAPELAHAQVFLVAEFPDVVARAGFRVQASYGLDNHPPIDLLIIVGGVHTEVMHSQQVLAWIKAQMDDVKQMATVCTGIFILANAVPLEDMRVATHWEDIPDLRQQFPRLQVVENQRWVDAGRVVSSAGISAGIDMSLYLVARFWGQALAEKTARQMDYAWQQRQAINK